MYIDNKTYHLIGLPTLLVDNTTLHSPLVNIITNMALMLKALGKHVIYYGVEGSQVICDEVVPIVSADEYQQYAATKTSNELGITAGYNTTEYYVKSHNILEKALRQRIQSTTTDYLLLTHVASDKGVQSLKNEGFITIEYAVSYPYRFAQHAIYPSYYQLFTTKVLLEKDTGTYSYNELNHYDFVIPHAISAADYTFDLENKQEYFVALGRIQVNKGYRIMVEIAKQTGIKLKFAGPFGAGMEEAFLQDSHNNPQLEYVGIVGKEEKRQLLSGAAGLLAPSTIYETYHIAATEAMMSGVPVICTDAGGMVETVIHGKTGFRCHSMTDFKQAIDLLPTLDRTAIATYAYETFSTDICQLKYEDVFLRIDNLTSGKGWYDLECDSNIRCLSSTFENKVVLVIVAHSDDELIEHGTFIKKSPEKDVYIVVVTDDKKIVDQRHQETLGFAKAYNVKETIFLHHEDGNIGSQLLSQELTQLITKISPDIILTHARQDPYPHTDHLLVREVVDKLSYKGAVKSGADNTYFISNADVEVKLAEFTKYYPSQITNIMMDGIKEIMKRETRELIW